MLTQEQIIALAIQEDKCYFYGESASRKYVDLTLEGFESVMNKAYAAGMAAGKAKHQPTYDKLYPIIRGFGYTTARQSTEITEAILKEQK